MQYEAIIMDLLSRIIKLEKEVADLKKERSASEVVYEAENRMPVFAGDAIFENKNSHGEKIPRENQKMTDDIIRMCYEAGEKLYQGKSAGSLTTGAVSKMANEYADQIVTQTGANRNSMIMYIYAVCAMLEGEIFKRAISSKAIKIYFEIIFKEHGAQGLKKAIRATRKHIEYRRECGQNVDSIAVICDQYESKKV